MKKRMDALLKRAMWISIIVFVIRCCFSWNSLVVNVSAYTVFGYIGEAIGVAAILIGLYEKWGWQWDPFIKEKNFKGKYKGKIVSNYDGSEREATLEIKQTFLSIDVKMITEESKSRTVAAMIEKILGVQELVYTYFNEPKASVRDRSEIHFGTARLSFEQDGKIAGNYYTDRDTRGEMVFEKGR